VKHSPVSRRQFLQATGAAGLALLAPSAAPKEIRPTINDVTGLNPVVVSNIVRPISTEEVNSALRNWKGSVSVGGGRFSMGGQIASPGSLHLDMRAMNRVLNYQPRERTIRVQAGMTWRAIQDHIDPHDQSVKIMQSYSNFTVGGSTSVNCHGRYVGRGPVINSIRALQVVMPAGEVLELSRTQNRELFSAVVGGYGGLAIITEVELDLEPNETIERVVQAVALEDYPTFFQDEVLAKGTVVLHNADLAPPNFGHPTSISWIKTIKPVTEEKRLIPRGQPYSLEKNTIWAISELPGGGDLRKAIDRRLFNTPAVVWQNYEASLDTAALEPRTRSISTYVLQEYFIPIAKFLPFARAMARILRERDFGVLNVSIRHSPADNLTLLSWAPVDVFCFVIYFKQRVTQRASVAVENWTRELVDAALANEGRYYLPYRLHPTPAQFMRAYPEATQFLAMKKRIDPQNRLRNMLWNRYLMPGSA